MTGRGGEREGNTYLSILYDYERINRKDRKMDCRASTYLKDCKYLYIDLMGFTYHMIPLLNPNFSLLQHIFC